jgi:glutamate-1-semialdehyde 2,1-aminomutase
MKKNEELFKLACTLIPGGVNSPVRAFGAVGGVPRFVDRAQGARMWDVEGNCYIDYVGSWGATIVGHAHPAVVEAVQQAATKGLGFGTPTENEVIMAGEISKLMPSMEHVRLVSSGTEAVMSALRLARGYTGRTIVLKFSGGYHGHVDSMLVSAGSGPMTFGVPTSDGVAQGTKDTTLVGDYNDIEGVQDLFCLFGESIAAVIVEPVAGNMNLVRATPDFLQKLDELCKQYKAVLIFDEVLSGFRVALGGAQSLYNIVPDITCLGKVIGGGLPLAAFGGRKEIMALLAPQGPVYQAGTLSGNPIALASGLATLKLVQQAGFYDGLSHYSHALTQGVMALAMKAGVELSVDAMGGIAGIYFSKTIPRCLDEVQAISSQRFAAFFHQMLAGGVYLAPSMYEVSFISSAHDEVALEHTLACTEVAFKRLMR